jgi:hypothetical protein
MAAGTGAIAQSAAGTQAARASADQTSQGQSTWPMDQLITASVHDAWLLSGRNEQKFFEMVTTLPDSEEAGKRFGEVVKSIAKTDHDQLLYVVVDKAVQQVAKKS